MRTDAAKVLLKVSRPPECGVPAKAGIHSSAHCRSYQGERDVGCVQSVAGVGPGFRRDAGVGGRNHYFYFGGVSAFQGPLPCGVGSDSRLASLPPTFSTRRRYEIWTISLVSRSVPTRPAGYSGFFLV